MTDQVTEGGKEGPYTSIKLIIIIIVSVFKVRFWQNVPIVQSQNQQSSPQPEKVC